MRACIGANGCHLLLVLCVLAAVDAGEPNFYPDGVPEPPDDIVPRKLTRYLSLGHEPRDELQDPRVLPYYPFSNGKLYRLLAAFAKDPEKLGWWIDWVDRGSRDYEYQDQKSPYYDRRSFNEDSLDYPQERPIPKNSYSGVDLERGMKEEPMLDFQGSFGAAEEKEERKAEEETERADTTTPEFTFWFDDENLGERHPFAVKPNDPRYYQDTPFSSEEAEKVTPSEPDGRTGYHPVVVPVNPDINNDIYFIAIVAGCSAAAMFALVLISLTWCRLQRGAKAAADIEYPAYGVTGPNKDVSPSGDQRLAQSAQMYHFQHQKQQIIAMENRTSATRDSGSVSEAESDEENEEGDYTVYECPGLASTGEMEVKNPLFHDDPTPATPAQAQKEEDHI